MSNLHAYADHAATLDVVPAFDAIGRVRTVVMAFASAIHSAVERRQTERFVARLPDHLLRDFGYERDWDGTVRTLRDEA